MQCRYCGKELALLKRLRGGGEFCSEAHKQSYQDEYNRLALSRLLQAQKGGQAESGSNPGGGRASSPVAVEDAPEAPAKQAAAEEPEMAPVEIGSFAESAGSEEESASEGSEAESTDDEPEPSEIAEFLLEMPAVLALAEETPYAESWIEASSGPVITGWEFTSAVPALAESAALAPLELPGTTPEAGSPAATVNPESAPREFSNGPGRPRLPWRVEAKHELPYPGKLAFDTPVASVPAVVDERLAQPLEVEIRAWDEDSWILYLPQARIDFPAEDAEVALEAEPMREAAPEAAPSATESGDGETEDDSPRASMEALARLHEQLIQAQSAKEEPAEVQAEAVAERVAAAPNAIPEVVEPVESTESPASAEASVRGASDREEPAVSSEAPAVNDKSDSKPGVPGKAEELLEVSVRMFPPAKPTPITSAAIPASSEPLLPRLKSLPLRPRMAVASGYVPPAGGPEAKSTPSSNKPSQTQPATNARAGTIARPAVRIAQPKPPAPAASKTAEPQKLTIKAPPAPVVSKAASAASPSEPANPKPNAEAALAPPASTPTPDVPAAPKAAAPKPAVETKDTPKPSPKAPPKEIPQQLPPEDVPSFGAMQTPSSSPLSSMKVKLGIGIGLVAAVCTFWLGWGGKSNKPTAASPAVSADIAGPSIIIGEGGWVEGWAGDPLGLHAGRQISIYRPSLKLSDYRIEFQGTIDAKSIGWVFRAADPQNYYALKLTQVSTGLTPKIALLKYVVINGRQTQAGRVPIDLPVNLETEYNIRTDVRGAQFTTSIQGRQVDVWMDDQLKIGGVGFLNERDERGKVQTVSIRYLNSAGK